MVLMSTCRKWFIAAGLAVGSVALEAGLMPLRGIDFALSGTTALVVFAAYTYLSLRFIRNVKQGIIVLSIAIGLLAVHLPIRIMYWDSTFLSLPDMIMHFIGIAFGFAFRISRKRLQLWAVAFMFVLIAVGYVYFTGLFANKLSYGTWTGKLEQTTVAQPLIFDTTDGEVKSLEDFEGKYLVLDFWATSCGACFNAFPDVQLLYDKYKERSDVELFSVHCRDDRHNEVISTGSEILLARGYGFPSLSMNIEDPVLAGVGINGYPAVLIFNPGGKLIFRGGIKSAGRYIDDIVE